MSKAFVKEDDHGQVADPLPDRPLPTGPNLVTKQGLAQIEDMIARLVSEQNSARKTDNTAEIAKLARDLRYWTARHATAQVVEPSGSGEIVEFGCRVTIRRDDGREDTYRIVGTDEAEPARGTLSHISPLARALLGKEVGESIRFGGVEATIITIH